MKHFIEPAAKDHTTKMKFAYDFNRDFVKIVIRDLIQAQNYMVSFMLHNVPHLEITDLRSNLIANFQTYGVETQQMTNIQLDQLVNELLKIAEYAYNLSNACLLDRQELDAVNGEGKLRLLKNSVLYFSGMSHLNPCELLNYTQVDLVSDLFDYWIKTHKTLIDSTRSVVTSVKSNIFVQSNRPNQTWGLQHIHSSNDAVEAIRFYSFDQFQEQSRALPVAEQISLWENVVERNLFKFQIDKLTVGVMNPIYRILRMQSTTYLQAKIQHMIKSLHERLASEVIVRPDTNQVQMVANVQNNWLRKSEKDKFLKIVSALINDHEQIAVLTIKSGFNSKYADENGWTIWHHWAVSPQPHTQVFEVLLNLAHEVINTQDSYNGWTALHALLNNTSIRKPVKYEKAHKLISFGADVEIECFRDEQTPLHTAVIKSDYSMANMLIENLAHNNVLEYVNRVDCYGHAALDYVKDNPHLSELLREFGAMTSDEISESNSQLNF